MMGGKRLAFMRAWRGCSLQELSERLDGEVSARTLSRYEKAHSLPSLRVLGKLAVAFGVTLDELAANRSVVLEDLELGEVPGLSRKARERLRCGVVDLVHRHHEIECIMDPKSLRPWREPCKVRSEEAEGFAESVHRNWNLGQQPIPSVTELLERRGIKVCLLDLPPETSGLHCTAVAGDEKDVLKVILINEHLNLEQRRMAMVQELFHLLARCPADESANAAGNFARAFLMPRSHVLSATRREQYDIGFPSLIRLGHEYQVCVPELLVRLHGLGVISKDTRMQCLRLCEGTRKDAGPRPLPDKDDAGNHELPRRFKHLCLNAFAQGRITHRKAEFLLQRSYRLLALEVHAMRDKV